MARINLREHFPQYEVNCFVEVPDGEADAFIAGMTDDIAAVYFDFQRAENAYQRRKYFHRAHYSLDAGDGIENDAVSFAPSPEQVFMDSLTREQLSAALAALSEKQRRRIYQHYFLGMSKAGIARAEGLAENAVKDAIYRGLKNMERFLKNPS